MKNMIKKISKCLIIYVIIFATLLTTSSYGYTAAEVSSAIAGYAKQYIISGNEKGILRYDLLNGKYKYSEWDPEVTKSPDGLHYFCCATFVSCVYEKVAGIPLQDHGAFNCKNKLIQFGGEAIPLSEAKPGDIVWRTRNGGGHVAIYLGNGEVAQASSADLPIDQQLNIKSDMNWLGAVRISESLAATITNLDTTYSISGVGGLTGSGTTYQYSKFFFNGIPDGKYSIKTTNLFDVIVDAFVNIVDNLIGMLTYWIRILGVGIASLFEFLLMFSLRIISTMGVDSGDLDINSAEIEYVDKDARELTIDSLLFNDYELFDIDIFDV